MSTASSNLKQAKLDFNVGKRTNSINKNGKPSQTSSKPVTVEVPKKKPSGKTETVETDNSYEDFIVQSSDYDEEEVSEAALSVDSVKSPGKMDAPAPSTGRTTRSSTTKNTPKKATEDKEQFLENLENPGVFRTSKANARSETSLAPAGTAPTTESKDTLPDLKIKDKKWTKHYAEVKEKMGGLSPIHGETQNKIHEILRVFDDSYEYGPCVGFSRLERWNRARALGLNPPKEVEEILNTKQGVSMPEYSQSVFYGEV